MRCVALLIVGALLACSSTDTAPADTGPADTAPACTQNGAAACAAYVAAYCGRASQCCTAGGTCNASACCPVSRHLCGMTCTVADCKAALLKTDGIDCSAAKWTAKTVCADVTTKCTDDLPLIACSDVLGDTVNQPASCKTFLSQFPP